MLKSLDGLQNLEQYQPEESGCIDDGMDSAQSEHDYILPLSCENIERRPNMEHRDHFDNCENVKASDVELKAYEAPE